MDWDKLFSLSSVCWGCKWRPMPQWNCKVRFTNLETQSYNHVIKAINWMLTCSDTSFSRINGEHHHSKQFLKDNMKMRWQRRDMKRNNCPKGSVLKMQKAWKWMEGGKTLIDAFETSVHFRPLQRVLLLPVLNTANIHSDGPPLLPLLSPQQITDKAVCRKTVCHWRCYFHENH